jgi:hypothetical protein
MVTGTESNNLPQKSHGLKRNLDTIAEIGDGAYTHIPGSLKFYLSPLGEQISYAREGSQHIKGSGNRRKD